MNLYIVRNGESLRTVARRFSVPEKELARLKALSDPDGLVPGLALALPGGARGPRRDAVVNAYVHPSLPVRIAETQLAHFSFFTVFCARMTAAGDLIVPDDAALADAARRRGAAPLLGLANLGEGGGFSGELAHAVLADGTAQDALLARLSAVVAARGYRGVSLHLGCVYPFDREACSAFVRRAAARLHENGCVLITALAPKEDDLQGGAVWAAQDYAAQGEAADWTVLTAYDLGHMHGEPRPLSPLGGIRRALDYAVAHIARQKILLGVSQYACSWTLPWREGDEASVLPGAAAVNLAGAAGAEIRFDEQAAAAHFCYRDAAGLWREVWFEDLRSVKARMALAAAYGLGGLSYWTAESLTRPVLLAQSERFSPLKLI